MPPLELYDDGLRFEASNIPRNLIDALRMLPDPTTPTRYEIELVGDLAGILHPSDANTKRPPARLGGLDCIEVGFFGCGDRI